MSTQLPEPTARLAQLNAYLNTELYSASVKRRYLRIIERFISYVESKNLTVEAVRAPHIRDFLLQELRFLRKRGGSPPSDIHKWGQRHATAVHLFLRVVQGKWPPPPMATTDLEPVQLEAVRDYDKWMRDLRGLASTTRSERVADALRFLTAVGERREDARLVVLTVSDIDIYVQNRCSGLRRRSIDNITSNLRGFLRFLHQTTRTAADLSQTVTGPRIHECENIPSALRAEEVKKVLEASRKDHSAVGLRDNAILMLLATYGMRAGEIIRLRLEDIDWRRDVLHVRHTKTLTFSELPLLRGPGEAILRYLEKGRPPTALREVFLRIRTPYRPFNHASSLYSVVQKRLASAGVVPEGKRGPHAFRHARAVGLLRATVPLKIIGDVLGHRSSHSTGVYLKLATNDLRSVGLDVPEEVSP